MKIKEKNDYKKIEASKEDIAVRSFVPLYLPTPFPNLCFLFPILFLFLFE